MATKQVELSLARSQEHSSLPGEIWKPVPSEPGVLASSEGRVLLPPSYAPVTHGGFRAYFPKPRFGQVSREHKAAKHSYRIIMVKRPAAKAKQAPRKVHQLICEAFHGPKPFPKAVVLHLDEDAHNNRPENLRWGTQKENLNAPGHLQYHRTCKRSDNTSGSTGVGWHKRSRKWLARIQVNGRNIHLGYFPDFEAAVAARKAAEANYGYHKDHGRVAEGGSE